MRSRLTLWALLGLSCATPAAAQLASQTALVGTVTDSGGAVVPGAQVVAVNTGTKDTYETTTNAEGYYNIQFVRTGTYEITVTRDRLSDLQGHRRRSRPATRSCAPTPCCKVGGLTESVNVEARAQVLDDRQRDGLGDDRQAGDRRAAAQWPQRLESRGHDPRRARGHQQRYRFELQRRRSAGDPEQPVARRHQFLGQPSGRDQHAADCRCGRRDSGPDRQHVGRVRVVSRRRDQRGDQERHQHPARVRLQLLQGRCAQFARLVSRTRRIRRIRCAAISSASRSTGRW